MKQLILILISAAIVNNVVLSQFLGLCPFLGVSKKVNTAAGMGGSVIFVVTLSSLVTGLIHDYILKPLGLDYLNTIVFILVIAALVQFIEMFLKKYVKNLYKSLGIYLPLITTNCCVLGTALNIVDYKYNVGTGTLYGFGVSAGFAIAIIMMAGVREKIEDNDIPHAFQGTGIVVLTAGLMAIAFFGFSGII